jgi:hypothetical protein
MTTCHQAGSPAADDDDLGLDLLLLTAQASGEMALRDALDTESGLAAIRATQPGASGSRAPPDQPASPHDPESPCSSD